MQRMQRLHSCQADQGAPRLIFPAKWEMLMRVGGVYLRHRYGQWKEAVRTTIFPKVVMMNYNIHIKEGKTLNKP
jgi:hypothetical protein